MRKFLLKPEHIKLLREAYIDWNNCEFGAPSIDCKRPYGNSDVYGDIAEILGWDLIDDGWGEKVLTYEQRNYAAQLHKETQTALQIIVQEARLSWGTYETTTEYGNQWRRVDTFEEVK